MGRTNLLTVFIVIGLVAGCLFGQFGLFEGDEVITSEHWTKQAGDLILIRPLMLLIIPLVFFSVRRKVTVSLVSAKPSSSALSEKSAPTTTTPPAGEAGVTARVNVAT